MSVVYFIYYIYIIISRPDRACGPPNLLYNGYRVFPAGKVRPGRPADHSPTF